VSLHDLVERATTYTTYEEANEKLSAWLAGQWYDYYPNNGGRARCTSHHLLFQSGYFADGMVVICESSTECEVPMALPAKFQQVVLLANHGQVRLREHHNGATFHLEAATGHWWDQPVCIESRDLMVGGFATLLFVP
jgi:hypothetical protein